MVNHTLAKQLQRSTNLSISLTDFLTSVFTYERLHPASGAGASLQIFLLIDNHLM